MSIVTFLEARIHFVIAQIHKITWKTYNCKYGFFAKARSFSKSFPVTSYKLTTERKSPCNKCYKSAIYPLRICSIKWNKCSALRRQCSDTNRNKKGWCTLALCQRETCFSSERNMFLSDEGPTLETLDFTIRIGSIPTFSYFDLFHQTGKNLRKIPSAFPPTSWLYKSTIGLLQLVHFDACC